jgi:hypothetical protein
MFENASGKVVANATTGSDGYYTTSLPSGTYTVQNDPDDNYKQATWTVTIAANQVTNIQQAELVYFLIPGNGWIYGVITDGSSQGVNGLQINAYKGWNTDIGPVSASTTTGAGDSNLQSLTSNDSGLYLFSLPMGEYTLEISGSGYKTVDINTDAFSGEYRMFDATVTGGSPVQPVATTGTISGTVTTGGQEISGATLSFYDESSDTLVSITTGQDGSYKVTLPAGQEDLTIQDDPYQTYLSNINVKSGATTVQNFSLTPVIPVQAALAANDYTVLFNSGGVRLQCIDDVQPNDISKNVAWYAGWVMSLAEIENTKSIAPGNSTLPARGVIVPFLPAPFRFLNDIAPDVSYQNGELVLTYDPNKLLGKVIKYELINETGEQIVQHFSGTPEGEMLKALFDGLRDPGSWIYGKKPPMGGTEPEFIGWMITNLRSLYATNSGKQPPTGNDSNQQAVTVATIIVTYFPFIIPAFM